MTPLATQFLRTALDSTVFPDFRKSLLKKLDQIHTFECSDVSSLLDGLDRSAGLSDVLATFGFLPAPKTWIEWQVKGARFAILFEESKGTSSIEATFFSSHRPFVARRLGVIEKLGDKFRFIGDARCFDDVLFSQVFLKKKFLYLVLINTPKIIGRRQYMPHRKLEIEITRKLGHGKFPLHAWTEIKLDVSKPIEIDDGSPHEAHLTGHRALHFCRAHLRVRLGRVEYVSSHWRGDPAIGIKQSRYRLTA